MKEKSLFYYADKLPPLNAQIVCAVNVLVVLKAAGELRNIDWKFIGFLWGIAVVLSIGKALLRKAADTEATDATRNA